MNAHVRHSMAHSASHRLASHWTNSDTVLVVVVIALVSFSAFLAYAETALIRTSRVRAAAMVEKRLKGAPLLQKLVDDPPAFLNPILLLTLICQLVAATLVGVISENEFGGVGVAVAAVIEVVIIFTLGEALPKNLSVRNSDRAALKSAGVVAVLVRLPPIRVLSAFVMGISRLLTPGGDEPPPVVSEEELLAMADAAVEGEVIETAERELIHSVISFGDKVAREIMIPRPDMVAISSTATLGEALETIMEAGFSRIPVYEKSVDNVMGIVFAKDLLGVERRGHSLVPVTTLTRGAHFVPETKSATELLKEMRGGRFHMAIVIDEYGSTAGLVTLEDLIEELVGDISDEYDNGDPDILALGEGGYEVSGSYGMDNLSELLDIELPDGDWDSIAGMIIGILGHLPEAGEEVEVDGYRFVVENVTARRIEVVKVLPNFLEG